MNTSEGRTIWTAGSTSTADTVNTGESSAGRTRYSYGDMCGAVWRDVAMGTPDELMRAVVVSQMAVADRLDRLCELMARGRRWQACQTLYRRMVMEIR